VYLCDDLVHSKQSMSSLCLVYCVFDGAEEALNGLGWAKGFCQLFGVVYQVVLCYASICVKQEHHHFFC
jgi:hypothetical protein